MNASSSANHASVFRIDRFVVPAEAMPAFMERVRISQQTLDTVPGCKQNLVLNRIDDTGECNVITVVEWSGAEAIAAAKTTIQAAYAKEGFDPAAFMQKLGVRADMGLYSNA
ncbi:hypothetical protein SAMN05216570_1632 [Dyella sp. OK004]|uniref:hypothetical protein n=1 Tax=Dyella sp. OK004 TaxID=1855292 RepID=UPI0008DF8246|nr:hypothetical protein [Dyella sp. OK004]SFS02563.1 hypothetical protein SAMN05216570_1632 [Dyella sp. OK004]